MAFLLTWIAGDKGKVLLYVGLAIAALLAYWGVTKYWEHRGAEKLRNKIRKEEADAQVRQDRAAGEYRRDGGARKRLRDGNF